MLATVKPVALGQKPSLLISPLSSSAVGLPRSADSDLTSLSWLQKPGVLSSMCTALTGSPHRHSRVVSRKQKPAVQLKSPPPGSSKSLNKATETDRMVNVILNVRSRKFDYENEWNKPPLSFACLIFMALESTDNKTLPVKEIYDYIEWKFPFYRTAPTGWKNSIRHNLSLNKCFKKLDRFSSRSKSALCKGGYWTVDAEYRRCLLEALERCPYHPYHNYTSPPASPSSSSSGSFESLGPDERDAALTMCMISGLEGDLGLLSSVYHDHSYCKKPSKPPPKRARRRKKGLTLDEIAAAAEMILAQEEESGSSSDELSESGDLGDSGYGGGESPIDSSLSMEELGADALLCLANNS